MEVINGIFYHAMGASGAALCYTPQKKVSGWSWHTYWLLQAAVCWLLLPVLVAWITIPQLSQVLQEAPGYAMQRSFLLGMAYGVGGTAFGIAIRYVGFSLTYAISVGISCVLGTLLPPLVRGTLPEIFAASGAPFLISGVAMGAAGIALCGLAGRNKEKDMAGAAGASTFSLAKGLPLCLLAGVLSALYGFSLDQGQPVADIAARHGAGHFQGNVIYLFSNTGAFVTTLLYCLYLHAKEKTFGEYAVAGGSKLSLNYAMAALTGLLWYGQFFFYGLGHVRMGQFKFSSWAIHMIMLVLLSALLGLVMKEWKNCSAKTLRILWLALTVLVAAILFLTYGNL
ncbi:L-rhamnose/proton symporter RhaT [Chitinophaga sp. sic0106]|uniref:L-rhamnose/proton symporter RhaT n=1 Tax=Chitinophaga sp. sic0106 TaxID=2854785 RepID=UPI001C4370CD|nr:L-rhamnose/proton symporter RhaT [Chitinophaga sp. sic0106]MBV7530206.1 rhamnose:proton symporter [Chitinophaga sp. sic0106]